MDIIKLIALLCCPLFWIVLILVTIGSFMPTCIMDIFAFITAIVIIGGIILMFINLFRW